MKHGSPPSSADHHHTPTSTSKPSHSPSASVNHPQSEFDRIRAEYNDVITSLHRTIRLKHPLWKGASEEEIDNAIESIEKFLTSKLYDRFFGLFAVDRAKDAELADKLAILHTWVEPRHLDLPVYCHDRQLWDQPSEEIRNMEKFKSPRDKLVCLLNCCHIINSILKRAKQRANADQAEMRRRAREKRAIRREKEMEKEKEQANEREMQQQEDASNSTTKESERVNGVEAKASTPSQKESEPSAETSTLQPTALDSSTPAVSSTISSGSSTRRNSIDDTPVPSFSPSADDLFPALIYTLIHAQPTHLYLNLVYISLCRNEAKLNGGESAYWYTNLAGAIEFILQSNERSFTFKRSQPIMQGNTSESVSAAVQDPKSEYGQLMKQGEEIVNARREQMEAEVERRRQQEAADAASKAQVDKETNHAAAALMSAAAMDGSVLPSPSNPAPSTSSIPGSMSASTPSSTSASPPPPVSFIHHHGPSSWSVASNSTPGASIQLTPPSPLPPPCIACLQLSHRRISTQFLDRSFTDLRVSELEDVLREYKELVFLIQGWQDHACHREMKQMPIPTKLSSPHANNILINDEGVALSDADEHSAAPSTAAVASGASSSASINSSNNVGATSSSVSRGWPLTNFLGLGRSTR